MKKIEDIRLENARLLIDKCGSITFLSDKIDRSTTQLSRLMGKNPTKIIGRRLSRHIEHSLRLEDGWMDQDRNASVVSEQNNNTLQKIVIHELTYPLITKNQAVNWSETHTDLSHFKHFSCPVPCGKKTFLLEVDGISMESQFKAGYLIWVDPEREAINKSYVVAFLKNKNEATFKQIIIEDGLKMLRAMNRDWPEQYIQIDENCEIIGTVVFCGWSL